MYNETRVQHVLSMGTKTQDFNCWGATKFMADHDTPTLSWVSYNDMGEWIQNNFSPIRRSEVKEGDIVALFTKEMRLIHTAYCVEFNKYVHKLGQNVAKLETLNRVLQAYAPHGLNGFVFLRSNKCE